MTNGLVVEKVEPQPTPKGMRGKWNIIPLNQPIPNLGLHKGGNLFPGGHDKLIFTGLYNEIGSFYEGPLPRDTVIRNNTFTNTFFDSIKVYTNGKGAVARNITITGNRITGWHTNPMNPKSAAAINLRNVVGGVIRNNTIGPGAAAPKISQPIRLHGCQGITQEANQVE